MTERHQALREVLVDRRGFRAELEHRFGHLSGSRLALVAVDGLRYIWAWEESGPVRRNYQHERDVPLKIINPIPPETALQSAVRWFLATQDWHLAAEWALHDVRERERRVRELDADLAGLRQSPKLS